MGKGSWKRIGTKKRAGVLAPLFSVYSKETIGIGDFNDLKLLVDWCKKTGNSILQLLPMNEVGATFCPYDAISSFALEPAYISLEAMPGAKDGSVKSRIDSLKKAFPSGMPHVDYRIKEAKELFFRYVYQESGDRDSGDFKKFVNENSYWIDDLALYKTLKNYHKGLPWHDWEDRYANRDTAELGSFQKKYEKEIVFHKWVQWILSRQFRDAKAYAGSKGVFICGDLPILISRDSAEVWAHPEFFKLEYAAGAPPDMYCAKGQRWGMPTYNWDMIREDGYRYIKEKLKHAENFYDILRVDHVVGLFRIWSIPYNEPMENEGLNGSFDPSDEKEWEEHGKAILSVMLKTTDMLLVAEDLGIIPRVCPETLKEFNIPGNDVQRWTKDWNVKHDFLKPKDYRALAVAMLSTHDTTNWAAWWENEAGTVDEDLFIRKCRDRRIDYHAVKNILFNPKLSNHGRLRWLKAIDSVTMLVEILGKKEEELKDFIEMYENSYDEKDRLWKHLKLAGPMREKSDSDIVAAALKITMECRSVFSIELLVDYLYLADIFKGDPYKYRINRPGTISKENWSLVIPMPLEGLLKHEVSGKIRALVGEANRI